MHPRKCPKKPAFIVAVLAASRSFFELKRYLTSLGGYAVDMAKLPDPGIQVVGMMSSRLRYAVPQRDSRRSCSCKVAISSMAYGSGR